MVVAGAAMVVGKKLRDTVENQEVLTAAVELVGRGGRGGGSEEEEDAKNGVDAV